MEFVAIADIHAHTYYNMGGFDAEFGSLRLRHIHNVLSQVFEYCKEHSIKHFLVLGDVFHTRGYISTFVVKCLQDVFSKFQQEHIEVVLLAGNHDQATKYFKPTALSVFKGVAKIIEEPEVYMNCLFIPYTSSEEQVSSVLDKKFKIVFGHLGVSGAVVGEGYELDSELSSELFRNQELVLLGHYHKPQVLNNIVYVGSPLHLNFSDSGQQKGFIHYKQGKVVFVNTSYPEFVICEIHNSKDLKKFVELYSEHNFYWLKNYTGKDIKLDRKNVKITDEKIDTQKFTPRIPEIHNLTDDELIKAFVKQFKLANSERYISYGLDVLRRVREEHV